MYLIFLDTETSGLNPEKHRILEIAYKIIDSITGRTVNSYSSVIAQPAEVWAQSDPTSLEITGFYWEDLLKGKTEKIVACEIANDLNCLDLANQEAVFICQNPSFDRSFFIQLINADLQEYYGWPYHWLDLASMYWTIYLLKNHGDTKIFKEHDLSKDAIAKSYGIPTEQLPHRAMNGVNHLIACYTAIFKDYHNYQS